MTAIEQLMGVIVDYENHQVSLKQFNEWMPKLIVMVEKEIAGYPQVEREAVCTLLTENLQEFSDEMKICLLSFLLFMKKEAKWNEQILKLAIDSEGLSLENKFYIYNSIVRLEFLIPQIMNDETKRQKRSLYRKIYEGYKEKLNLNYDPVPVHKRNEKTAIFFIGQFLGTMHGPTKTILDRVGILAACGWQVHIINTLETVGDAGKLPFYTMRFATYIKEYEEKRDIIYQDFHIPFWQCRSTMPELRGLKKVLDYVKKVNPYCLFMIGGSGITADLCSNLYPLITVNTVPSGITVTEGQFQLIGRQITEEDLAAVSPWGFSENHLQYCRFTSSIVEEDNLEMKRADLELPEDKFLAIVVGWRLEYEVNEEFIEEVLLPLVKNEIVIIFMGIFSSYQTVVKRYPLLGENSLFLKNVKNVLPYYRNVNVYLNPKRAGGGTSVVEAMYCGVPPVSLAEGDVSLGAGEEFLVSDYKMMVEQVLRFKEDAVYYEEKCAHAKKRSEWALDSRRSFCEALERIEKLPEFQ